MLSESDSRRIASLVNAVMSAQHMLNSRNRDGSFKFSYAPWADSRAAAVVALADEFGVELPSLPRARAWMADNRVEPDGFRPSGNVPEGVAFPAL